jgi:hypothetical protein
MTLDELMKVYDKAASDVAFLQYEGPDHRAGIRAVVAALQDAVVKVVMNANVDLPRHEAVGMVYRQFINEILASDGVEAPAIRAAAGGGEDPLPHLNDAQKALFVSALLGKHQPDDAGPTTPPKDED